MATRKTQVGILVEQDGKITQIVNHSVSRTGKLMTATFIYADADALAEEVTARIKDLELKPVRRRGRPKKKEAKVP